MPYFAWQELLVERPPGVKFDFEFSPILPTNAKGSGLVQRFTVEEYCENEDCEGVRKFRLVNDLFISKSTPCTLVLPLVCSNCCSFQRFYALVVFDENDRGTDVTCVKFGQYPAFGPSLPSRLSTLVGADRELFFKGYRSEKQGFGVGAYAYYRQVVENQKGRLIGKIVEVAEREGVEEAILQRLRRAATETQFSASLDLMKDSVPPKLLIHGHNPLALLHRALSQGLHNWSDDACLELATDIREILSKLAEQISVALADDARVREAITRLNNLNPGKSQD